VGALDALGFSPAELARLRPGIITLSLSAYGTAGPWRGRRGFDSVVQSASGIAWEPADAGGGLRARDGGSYHIDLSLAQTGRYLAGLSRADAALVAAREQTLPAVPIDSDRPDWSALDGPVSS
jgi:crotonobetainyl-CoA:carnitine CoA-transferase CaiB-like acyl-CoA transferase